MVTSQFIALLCLSFLTFVCLPVWTTSVFRQQSLPGLLKHLPPRGFNAQGGSEQYWNTSKNNCNETAKAQSAKFSHKNGLSNM